MNKDLRIGRKLLCLVIALVMILTLIPRLPASMANAAAGEEPDHAKILQVNEDRTYTLALNVKGDSEKKIQHVNVIVIVDRSGSMGEQSGTGAYVPSNQNWQNMNGLVDGQYVALERRGGYGNYTYWYNGEQYTGKRYQYDATATRMQATQAAVNSLAEQLLEYNGMIQSMSRKGNCYDNCITETFFGRLKNEMFYGHEKEYSSFEEFSKAIDEYIYYYNNERIQSKTKWMPPVKYREASNCLD